MAIRHPENAGEIGIVSGGKMGLALAKVAAENGFGAIVFKTDPRAAEHINERHWSEQFGRRVKFQSNLRASSDLGEVCSNKIAVVLALPSTALPSRYGEIMSYLDRDTPILSAVKALQIGTGFTTSEFIINMDPERQVAVVSGPNLADEVVRRGNTKTMLAANNPQVNQVFQQILGTEYFVISTSRDVKTAEIYGAYKNVAAIGAGMINAHSKANKHSIHDYLAAAAKEMSVFREAMKSEGEKIDPAVFLGPPGLGDLSLACARGRTRNEKYGYQVGRKVEVKSPLTPKDVTEGFTSAQAFFDIAEKLNLEARIVRSVHGVLFESWSVDRGVGNMLGHELERRRRRRFVADILTGRRLRRLPTPSSLAKSV